MELVYAALLLHSTKHKIDEHNITKIMEAAGGHADATKIKALVASLEGVNIDEAIAKAAMPVAAPAAKVEEKAEKTKEEEATKKAEEAVGGLASLFG